MGSGSVCGEGGAGCGSGGPGSTSAIGSGSASCCGNRLRLGLRLRLGIRFRLGFRLRWGLDDVVRQRLEDGRARSGSVRERRLVLRRRRHDVVGQRVAARCLRGDVWRDGCSLRLLGGPRIEHPCPRVVIRLGLRHVPQRAPHNEAFAELQAPELSTVSGRKLVHELDLAWHLVLEERLADLVAELGLELLGLGHPGRENDERPHELAAPLEIADADHRARGDGLVRAKGALGLVRAEALASTGDDVGLPADEPEEAVRVDLRQVSRRIPVAAERLLRLLR